jgi:GNAT superfamily N-acetyltransferase
MTAGKSTGIVIRRATRDDAQTLARMRASSAFERHGGDVSERAAYERVCSAFFAAHLAAEESFLRSWIALRGTTPAGGASLTLFPTLPRYGQPFNGIDGRIRDVYVEPAFRRSGVARALMDVVLLEARALGIDRLTLGASSMGRPLYESLGFVGKLDEMVFEPES